MNVAPGIEVRTPEEDMTDKTQTGTWFDPFGLNPALGELGQASGAMMEAWAKAWQANLAGRTIPAMGFFNPDTWARGDGSTLAEAFEGWLGTPQWSDLLSLDSDTLKALAPTAELSQLGRDYAAATAQVALEICRKFQARVAGSGQGADAAGDALDIWNEVLDESLMAFNRSDAFADLQRRFVRALMACRTETRRVVERMAEQVDLPTRSEVDEISRRVHALERETRRLKRTVAALQSLPETGDGND